MDDFRAIIPSFTLCSVATLFALGAFEANGEIYKWVDENGKTHFSDKKTGR